MGDDAGWSNKGFAVGNLKEELEVDSTGSEWGIGILVFVTGRIRFGSNREGCRKRTQALITARGSSSDNGEG